MQFTLFWIMMNLNILIESWIYLNCNIKFYMPMYVKCYFETWKLTLYCTKVLLSISKLWDLPHWIFLWGVWWELFLPSTSWGRWFYTTPYYGVGSVPWDEPSDERLPSRPRPGWILVSVDTEELYQSSKISNINLYVDLTIQEKRCWWYYGYM